MLLMPGSWGWSRGLVPLQAAHGSFPWADRCDSQNSDSISQSLHMVAVIPQGEEKLASMLPGMFSKMPLLQVPRTVTVFWGRGDKYKKSCSYARNVRSWTGLLQRVH